MLRITIERRTTKQKGSIKLRFRVRDGRNVQMYYRSGIMCDVAFLDKITDDGRTKPRVKVIDNTILEEINANTNAIREAYKSMINSGMAIKSEILQAETDKILHHSVAPKQNPETIKERFQRYIEEGFKNDVFGKSRRTSYQMVGRILERFLRVAGKEQITAREFDADMVVKFSNFIRDEFEYVPMWNFLYEKMRDIPKEPRKRTTVAARIKILRSFFNTLAQRKEIDKTPFELIDKSTKKSMLRENYDVPISLTLAELDKLRVADVPENLRETRDAFVLQCSIGCRIGDFQKISMDNVDVVDGVPFVHYLPTKTARQSRQELPTPLIPFAVDIINKYGFHFKILHNISGKDGYNSKIKKLIQYCKIDRLCSVYDEREKTEIRKPLYEIASSKLARKTFVNLCATCQIDMYASGLHSRSSNAVERYAHIDIQERYRLICYAFNQPLIKVDDNLQPLTDEKPTDRITAIIAGLSESEKNKLRELLGSNQ